MSAAGPSQGANCAPAGGSAAAKPQAWGDHIGATALADAPFGPWNPGLRSQVPAHLRHLCTIFLPENVFTTLAEATELRDLTGLEFTEVVAFRPRRLALHELLIRVTADFSVPDGLRIEDLGINFRAITRVLLTRHVEPRMGEIESAYAATRSKVVAFVDSAMQSLFPAADAPRVLPPPASGRSILRFFGRGPAKTTAVDAPIVDERQIIAEWERRAFAASEPPEAAAYRAVARVVSALLVRHGRVWGAREAVATLATGLACNDAASEAIGRLIEPWLTSAAPQESYRLLPRQRQPVVMNTKGPSASGKSTLRPLQRKLAGDIGVNWSEFALISPDIWRKQLIDYDTLGANYKYGASFTGEELQIVDHKLDRYMARKAERGDMPHLLIDRFRFDSFAPDSNEAGSNLLTRFGQIIYLFFMITPPASLVERAWKRGLEVGRYKAVDDTLAHGVEAYSGMPELFFTWIRRTDKRVHFEFLDNSVELGERPRTVAFGWNGTLNVLDIGRMLDVERFRRVDVDATAPELLFPEADVLQPARNTGFLKQCVEQFSTVNFADQDTGRVYLRMIDGTAVFADREALQRAAANADTRAGVAAVAPDALTGPLPAPDPATRRNEVAGIEDAHTLGRWGGATRGDAA